MDLRSREFAGVRAGRSCAAEGIARSWRSITSQERGEIAARESSRPKWSRGCGRQRAAVEERRVQNSVPTSCGHLLDGVDVVAVSWRCLMSARRGAVGTAHRMTVSCMWWRQSQAIRPRSSRRRSRRGTEKADSADNGQVSPDSRPHSHHRRFGGGATIYCLRCRGALRRWAGWDRRRRAGPSGRCS